MSDQTARLSAALAERYTLVRELGQGGMATVYLARDRKHERDVAIKVLKPELAAVLGAERFVQEIRTTAAMQHPHILPLFDSGTVGGFLYYVMPFIDGETLRARLDRETQLPVDDAVQLAREVADALHYAHSRGIVHRDVKPENIMLHGGHALVADFGIALAVSAAAGGRMTETGLSLGTPHYMSPEQATAEKEITGRSDIYSLGSVLYEALSGQPPHLGGSAQQIVMKIIADTPRPLRELRTSVPRHVAAAVATSLEKIPADRFATAADFARALHDPAYHRANEPAAEVHRAARRVDWRATAIAAVVMLGVGATAARLWWRERAAAAPTVRMTLALPTLPAAVGVGAGVSQLLAQRPDGTGIVYWSADSAGGLSLLTRSWDRLADARTTLHEDEACCLTISPAGDSVAYFTKPHTLKVASLTGGRARVVADSGVASMTDGLVSADWGSDGWIYVTGTTGVFRVRASGGAPERVSTLDRTRRDVVHVDPTALPGARGVLLSVAGGNQGSDGSIGLADGADGTVKLLTDGLRARYSPSGHLVVARTNGVLWALPFDVTTGRVTGPAWELADTLADGGTNVEFSLSPTGTLIYRKRVNQSVFLTWVDRRGVSVRVARDLTGQLLDEVALSPDGTRVLVSLADAAAGPSQLWIKRGDAPRARITFEGFGNFRAQWRPRSNTVSYHIQDSISVRSRLVERDVGGGGVPRALFTGDRRAVSQHAWSPDGVWLLLRTDDQEAGNADILGIRPGIDSVARPLVATPAEELSPAVSPDGRWLAYSSDESGRREVYIRPFPETSAARYLVSTGGGSLPVWRRDGRELFYLDRNGNMVAALISNVGALRIGAPQVLFAVNATLNPFGRGFDVSPDGAQFLLPRSERNDVTQLVVVFNFAEELRRRSARP